MIELYSHRIQNVIQKELFTAQRSIKIAVAWFTNDLLFQPLLLKLQLGIRVELVLNKDEINFSESNDINFLEFVKEGGILHWNDSKTLMHEKFCIIDDSTVIYGTYNWTNKAEYNDESITLSKDEQSIIDFYLKQFEKLSSKYPAEKVSENEEKEKIGQSIENQSEKNDGLDNQNEMDEESIKIRFHDAFLIRRDGLCGIRNSANNLILPAEYEDLDIVDAEYIITKKNGKYGLFKWPHVVWDCDYDSVGFVGDDFFKMKKGSCIYVVRNREIIIGGEYDDINLWSEADDLPYFILKRNGLYGLSEGKTVKHECIFEELDSPEAPVKLNGYYGLLDEKGNVLVDFKYVGFTMIDEL